MTEPADEALAHRELDGENTAEESAAFLTRIETEDGLRKRYLDLLWLKAALGRVGRAEPPAGLSAEIMRAVRGDAGEGGRSRWWEVLRAPFVRTPAFGYALATAAGILVGAFLGPLGAHGRISPEGSAAGTILPEGRLATESHEERQSLVAEGLRGEVVAREREGKVLAEISLESDRPLDLALGFDSEAFSPVGFERRGVAAGSLGLAPGQVLIQGAGGSGLYTVTLMRLKATPWVLRLTLAGQGVNLRKVLEEKPGS
jgi:hypothetical protein